MEKANDLPQRALPAPKCLERITAGSSRRAPDVAPADGMLPGVVVQVIAHRGTTARWQRDQA